MILAFTAYGVAQPKGSMRAFVPRGFKYPIITDSNRSARSWAQVITERANAALAALPEGERTVITGPVRLTVAFYLPRPKRLQKRGKVAAHCTAPDLDKLTRAVGDALAGVVYHDDAQIVEAILGKFYAEVDEPARAEIRIEPTAGTGPRAVLVAPGNLFESGVHDALV